MTESEFKRLAKKRARAVPKVPTFTLQFTIGENEAGEQVRSAVRMAFTAPENPDLIRGNEFTEFGAVTLVDALKEAIEVVEKTVQIEANNAEYLSNLKLAPSQELDLTKSQVIDFRIRSKKESLKWGDATTQFNKD